MTLATLAGFVAVLAIAARGGIAVITPGPGVLEAEDGGATRATAVVEAAGERLGPIVTTAIATMVALVPLIVTGTIPGPGDRPADRDRRLRRADHDDARDRVPRPRRSTPRCGPGARPSPDPPPNPRPPDGGIRMPRRAMTIPASDRGGAERVGLRLLGGGRGGGRRARDGRGDRGLRPVQGRAAGRAPPSASGSRRRRSPPAPVDRNLVVRRDGRGERRQRQRRGAGDAARSVGGDRRRVTPGAHPRPRAARQSGRTGPGAARGRRRGRRRALLPARRRRRRRARGPAAARAAGGEGRRRAGDRPVLGR